MGRNMRCCNSVTILALVSVSSMFLLLVGQANAMPPVQCSPNYIEDLPPRIRKVCAALSTLYDLGAAMENYINEKSLYKY